MNSARKPFNQHDCSRRLSVLIVDDEPMLRSVIEEFLGLIGYDDPVLAGDGREALELLRRQPFDCMISDIRMPEMALEDLLSVINQEFPRLVVVATSGYSDFESALNIIDKGAHDFLGKPLNLDALEMALTWVVRRQPIMDRAAALFGKAAETTDADLETRLDNLDRHLVTTGSPFEDHLRHARRVAALARRLHPLFSAEDGCDLALAAMLHEMGSSHVMQSLVDQPRRLDNPELHLVRAHAQISGRLTAGYLQRPEFGPIIGEHLHWGQCTAQDQDHWPRVRRLSVWLGLLNYVDGCLRERPDRMPYSPDQVHESLKRRLNATHLAPIAQLLEHWQSVEQCYPAA